MYWFILEGFLKKLLGLSKNVVIASFILFFSESAIGLRTVRILSRGECSCWLFHKQEVGPTGKIIIYLTWSTRLSTSSTAGFKSWRMPLLMSSSIEIESFALVVSTLSFSCIAAILINFPWIEGRQQQQPKWSWPGGKHVLLLGTLNSLSSLSLKITQEKTYICRKIIKNSVLDIDFGKCTYEFIFT